MWGACQTRVPNMEKTILIKNRQLYKFWFVELIRRAIAQKEVMEDIQGIEKRPDDYFKLLFAVGNIKPGKKPDTSHPFFKAHLKGLAIASKSFSMLVEKYPKIQKLELVDARLVTSIADWAHILSGQAAAACNAQSDEGNDAISDADRCVRAWNDYNDAAIDLGMAQDNLRDCEFQNSNPEVVLGPDDDGPFSVPPVDPCLHAAMDVVLAENNVNAAWDDINVYC